MPQEKFSAAHFVIFSILLLSFFSVFFKSAETPSGFAITTVNGCQNITSSGDYALGGSITNSANGICINISTSNIAFDCQMNTIDGTDASSSVGISVNGINNITIKNCVLTDWENATNLFLTSRSIMQNSTLSSNTVTGTGASNSTNLTIINNNFTNNLYGVFDNSDKNLTITGNNMASMTTNGIYSIGISNSSFVNNTIHDWSGGGRNDGIILESSVNNEVRNNTIKNISSTGTNGAGILLTISNYTTISFNNIDNTGHTGIYGISTTISSYFNIIKNNTLNALDAGGIFISEQSGATTMVSNSVINNTVNNSGNFGVQVTAGNNTIIGNGLFHNSGTSGILLTGSFNTLINNTISYSSIGISAGDFYGDSGGSSNVFINNSISFSTADEGGIFFSVGGTNNTINNTVERSNSVSDFRSAVGPGSTKVNNLDIGTAAISFNGINIDLFHTSVPSGIPTGFVNISRSLVVTPLDADAYIFLNMSYSDSDVSGINESSVTIARYNQTNWSSSASEFSVANSSGVNLTNNYAFANITNIFTAGVKTFTLIGKPNPTTTTTSSTTTTTPPGGPPTPSCKCDKPSDWSACIAGNQSRTNYNCGASTSYSCLSYRETKSCEVEKKNETVETNQTNQTLWVGPTDWSSCSNGIQDRLVYKCDGLACSYAHETESCAQCPLTCGTPSTYSLCKNNKEVRANYICNSDTGFSCKQVEQSRACLCGAEVDGAFMSAEDSLSKAKQECDNIGIAEDLMKVARDTDTCALRKDLAEKSKLISDSCKRRNVSYAPIFLILLILALGILIYYIKFRGKISAHPQL